MANVGDAATSQGDIMRRLRDLESMVRELTAGRRLENASIGQGGLRVREDGSIRSETFDGNLILGDPGTAGWALGADRLAIRGQLVSPVEFRAAYAYTTGWAVAVGWDTMASLTLTPPTWATEVLLTVTMSATARNTSGATDILWGSIRVAGQLSEEGVITADREDGLLCHLSTNFATVAGVTGPGSVLIEGRLSVPNTAAGWTADSNNTMTLAASAVYRRIS